MAVLSDAVWLVRTAGGWLIRRRARRVQPVTRQQNQRLAEVMRRLPGRYVDRLPERTIKRVSGAAAAGDWEYAAEALIAELSARSVPISPSERDELAVVVEGLGLVTDWIEDLDPCVQAHQAAPVSAGAPTRNSVNSRA